jgi:hypothetical protein
MTQQNSGMEARTVPGVHSQIAKATGAGGTDGQTSFDPPADLQAMREIYAYLKQLSQSDNALVRDASVLMLALAHDVLRNIDVEHPPEHIALYE